MTTLTTPDVTLLAVGSPCQEQSNTGSSSCEDRTPLAVGPSVPLLPNATLVREKSKAGDCRELYLKLGASSLFRITTAYRQTRRTTDY